MDHGGEAARPATAESTETDLGTAGAVQEGEANMSTTGTFHVLWVPVAVFQSEHGHRVAYANVGAFWRQPGPVVDSALQQHRPGARLGVVLAAPLRGGGTAYNVDYALQPRLDAGHGEVHVDLLPVSDSAGHGEVVFVGLLLLQNEEFIGPLAGSVGALFVNSSNFFVQQNFPAVPGTGHADGIDDGAVALADDPGMAPEQLRRLLPLAGIGASSVALNGLAAGPGSPAVAFHLFLLLLGGLLLVILHVLRV